MNLYFDTEFTGLVPGTALISLGIVSENGEKFYAEFTDYDRNKITPWIEENVIKNLRAYQQLEAPEGLAIYEPADEMFDFDYCLGDTSYIREKLLEWIKWHAHELKGKESQRVQFVSDVCHYDFYLLQNQVFGGAFKMPDYINPVCYDICQDINEWSCMGVGNNFNITRNMYNAFDISREELVENALLELPNGRKHNALYDAEVIKLLYEYYYTKKFAFRKFETAENFKHHRGWCRDTFDSWFEDAEYLYEMAIEAMKKYSEDRKE